ncbi:plasma membrane-associated cation-binding protein 1 [Cryptomeria japonica]|uniref:plasma membrane-associated cation-binding protein 1 n=1 Tax=Cryptomeria japonica TaxID=3369 RepID=UPI0027DA08B7|nr:plasma membrane-associated cation-binding protein 1 [Cryptomeria japonica]
MTYWKAKLLPRIKKYFGKGPKKGAVEAAKSFEQSKESIENEIQEKKAELEPKVVEIYKDSKPETKMLLKEPSEERVKKQGQAIVDLLQRLVEIGCPGAQVLKETGDKYGAASMSVQIAFLFEKISPFVSNEEAPSVVVEEEIVTAKEVAVETETITTVSEEKKDTQVVTETTKAVVEETEVSETVEKEKEEAATSSAS